MTQQRTKIARFTKITQIDNLISILSTEQNINSVTYNVFTVFSADIWVLIITFLILISILGTKSLSKNTFLLQFLNSMIDHLECLIRNCCE